MIAHERMMPPRAYWLVAMVALAIATVLTIYSPLLSARYSLASDGQFAQFFESSPGWSDLYMGGWARYADPNAMYFYPLRFLFAQTRHAFNYFSLAALVIFSLGNGALAGAVTRSRRATALAVAASPGLGFMAAHLGHTSMIHAAAYAPWMILAGLRLAALESSWPGWVALLALVTGLSLVTGHTQLTVYGLCGSALMAMPMGAPLTGWLRVMWRVGVGVLLGAGLAAVFLLPAMALVGETLRASITADTLAQFSLRPFELGIDVFPYAAGGDAADASQYAGTSLNSYWWENIAFVGACLPFLVIFGWKGIRSDATGRKMLVGLGVTLILAMAPSLAVAASALLHVPVFSLFRAWARWQLVSSVILLQLACLAFARLPYSTDSTRRTLVRLLLAWALILALPLSFGFCEPCSASGGVASLFRGISLVQWALLAVATAAVLVARYLSALASVGFGIVMIVLVGGELGHLARHAPWRILGGGTTTARETAVISQVKSVLAESDGRLLTLSGWKSPYLSPDHARLASIESINWYGPLLSKRFAEATGMTLGGWTRPDVMSESNQVLDIYGVTLVEPYTPDTSPLSDDAPFPYPTSRWQPIASDNPGGLLFNTRSLPRVRLVGQALDMDDAQALVALRTSRLPDGGWFRASKAVLVDQATLAIPAGTSPMQAYRVLVNEANAVDVSFDAPTSAPTILAVGDNFSRNWHAQVDGRPVDVARINYSQLGVPVPKGAREVRLEYRDETLRIGIIISLLAALATALAAVTGIRGRRARGDKA